MLSEGGKRSASLAGRMYCGEHQMERHSTFCAMAASRPPDINCFGPRFSQSGLK